MRKNEKKTRRTTPPPPEPVRQRAGRPAWATYWPLGCPLPDSVGYEKLPWPEQVPVLAEADLVVDADYPPAGGPPYTLEVWLEKTFGLDGHVATVAALALDGAITESLKRSVPAWEFLRTPGVTKADAVRVWKEAMGLLGYDLDRVKKPVKEKEWQPPPMDYGVYRT
jgi:hypothetical protein